MKVHYARGFFPNENFPGGGGGREHIHPKMGPNSQGGHKTKWSIYAIKKKCICLKWWATPSPWQLGGDKNPGGRCFHPPRVGVFRWRLGGKWRGELFCEFFYKSRPMRREDQCCAAFLLVKNSAKKITNTPTLYPSSKNSDSVHSNGGKRLPSRRWGLGGEKAASSFTYTGYTEICTITKFTMRGSPLK